MTRVLLAVVVVGCPILGHLPPGFAETRMTGLEMAPDGGVEIEIIGCFDTLPPSGYAPVRVRIANRSPRPGAWTFRFRSGGYAEDVPRSTFTWTAAGPAETERAFDVCVPLTTLAPGGYAYQQLEAFVSGPRVTSGRARYAGRSKYTGHPRTPFVGFSRRLAARWRGPLESELEGRSRELQCSRLDPDGLSDDWRSYLGFASVWITAEEWAGLRDAGRRALLQWVIHGGTLVYVSPEPTRPALRSAGLPVEDVPASACGAGWIMAFPAGDGAGDVSAVAARIIGSGTVSAAAGRAQDDPASWRLWDRMPEAELNVGLILAAMLLFAAVVGPINLRFLAGRAERHRLFLSTPVISLGASLLIAGLILFEDGIGGEGIRVALVQMRPEERCLVVHQEQVSRTGVMLGGSFPLPADAHLSLIPSPSPGASRPRLLRRRPAEAGGEWFASRSRQAHYLARVIPSRARVEIVNPAAVRAGRETPVVLSTFDADLVDLFYHDPRGTYWYAPRLRVGERVALQPSSQRRFLRQWWSPRMGAPGIRAGGAAERLRERPGFLYAGLEDAAGLWIETHPGVRWREERAVAIGPCLERKEAGR